MKYKPFESHSRKTRPRTQCPTCGSLLRQIQKHINQKHTPIPPVRINAIAGPDVGRRGLR